MRKFFVLIIVTIFILNIPAYEVYAAPGINSVGGLGVNNYGGSSSGCYGDRAGASLVKKLMGRFPSDTITHSYKYLDSDAYPSRFKNSSTVDLFIYSGHGVKKSNYNTPHFYASSASKTSHTGSDHLSSSSTGSFEVDTTTVVFKHAYVAVYTCNWLNFDSNTKAINQFKTFGKGCRLQLGYGSQMYLDSREGNAFGYHMMDYVETVKDAFFNAATYYQSQSNSDVIVRVAGYKSAMSDTAYSGSNSTPPGYSGNTSQYEYYTKTVPGTGKKL